MWSAFHGTPDDEWPTPLDAAADAVGTLAGTWGPVVWDASLAAEIGSQLVAAAVVVRDDKHEYVPLLAFAMTDPAYQGYQGYQARKQRRSGRPERRAAAHLAPTTLRKACAGSPATQA